MQHLENPFRPVNVLMHYIENVNHGPNLAQTTQPLALSLTPSLYCHRDTHSTHTGLTSAHHHCQIQTQTHTYTVVTPHKITNAHSHTYDRHKIDTHTLYSHNAHTIVTYTHTYIYFNILVN